MLASNRFQFSTDVATLAQPQDHAALLNSVTELEQLATSIQQLRTSIAKQNTENPVFAGKSAQVASFGPLIKIWKQDEAIEKTALNGRKTAADHIDSAANTAASAFNAINTVLNGVAGTVQTGQAIRQAINPTQNQYGAGTYQDPNAYSQDPNAEYTQGQGLTVDPTTGLPIDPTTGTVPNASSVPQVDANGQPIDSTAQQVDASGQPVSTDGTQVGTAPAQNLGTQDGYDASAPPATATPYAAAATPAAV